MTAIGLVEATEGSTHSFVSRLRTIPSWEGMAAASVLSSVESLLEESTEESSASYGMVVITSTEGVVSLFALPHAAQPETISSADNVSKDNCLNLITYNPPLNSIFTV